MSGDFEFSVDVLVAGGGACGAVAGLAAHDAGASVLIVEQDANPHGTTSMSQGLFCAAGTQSQAAHGVDDDPERFFADIMAKTRGQTDPVIARAIATESAPALEWLRTRHAMPWELDTGFRAAYGNSVMRVHGWPGHSGADMIQLLHARLAEAGIDVLTQARLVDIIADDHDRVLGVAIERPGGVIERIGCRALVLATGGFAGNRAMIAQYMPEAAEAKSNGHEGCRGDGIRLGAALGGALADMGSYQGYAMLADPHNITVPPGVLVVGGVIVNAQGRRFVDELADIAGMVHDLNAQPDGVGWVIADARIDAANAYIPEAKALAELNAARVAGDVTALAAVIGCDAGVLAATFADLEAAHATAAADATGRVWGEDPPPRAPFSAIKVGGAIFHTQGGLQTDGEARVLRADGSRLPNLFAGGGAARGVSGPSSWGYLPAMGLCAAVTTGRIAGRAAAGVAGS